MFCIVTVVRVHVLYCDSDTRDKGFEMHCSEIETVRPLETSGINNPVARRNNPEDESSGGVTAKIVPLKG
jgi:hypothetical protein